jgi:hypothetical protein
MQLDLSFGEIDIIYEAVRDFQHQFDPDWPLNPVCNELVRKINIAAGGPFKGALKPLEITAEMVKRLRVPTMKVFPKEAEKDWKGYAE